MHEYITGSMYTYIFFLPGEHWLV